MAACLWGWIQSEVYLLRAFCQKSETGHKAVTWLAQKDRKKNICCKLNRYGDIFKNLFHVFSPGIVHSADSLSPKSLPWVSSPSRLQSDPHVLEPPSCDRLGPPEMMTWRFACWLLSKCRSFPPSNLVRLISMISWHCARSLGCHFDFWIDLLRQQGCDPFGNES